MKTDINQIKNVLLKFFGFEEFRNGQDEAVESILSGRNTLVVMPTGGGKSLCYQLPAVMANGIVIVISPLIALMKDQVDSLNAKGIPSTFINSSIPKYEIRQRLEDIALNKYKLVYIAPERLKNKVFIDFLKHIRITFLAVDEAHCISEWGHDFRPAYLAIKDVFKEIPDLPVIALTATATPEVRGDIIENLDLENTKSIVRGFDRPNLSYKCEIIDQKLERVVEICSEQCDGSIVIYCGSRKRVETISSGLNGAGIRAAVYHAGMAIERRRLVQERFIRGKDRIIVATNAFGMGIDKADVRKVIHCDLTQTLEAYYQEAGRAGRDGKEAECILLYYPSDRRLQEFFINTTYPPLSDLKKVYNTLYDINSVAIGDRSNTPVILDVPEIANRAGVPLNAAKSVISLLERNNIISKGSANKIANIRFTTSRERIIEYFNNVEGDKKTAIEAILRNVSSEAFDREVSFDLNNLLVKYHISFDRFNQAVRSFTYARLMTIDMPGSMNGFNLLAERAAVEKLPIDYDALNHRRSKALEKLNIVQRYAETKECKRNYILKYFNDDNIKIDCGKCSSCLNRKAPQKKAGSKQQFLTNSILKGIYEINGKFGRTVICDFLKGIKTAKLREYKLYRAKNYAVCKEFSINDIKYGIESAIVQGLVSVTGTEYPKLIVTDTGINQLNLNQADQFGIAQKQSEINQDELYYVLKSLRDDLAGQAAVVGRAIISDKMLRNIANASPATTKQLATMKGIGPGFHE